MSDDFDLRSLTARDWAALLAGCSAASAACVAASWLFWIAFA